MSRKPARRRQQKAGLTILEQKFVAEYMVDGIAGKALVRAGSRAKHPDQQAYEMLRKPHIAAEIEKRIAGLNEKTAMNAQWVLNELGLLYQFHKAGFLAPGENGKRNLAAGKEARVVLEKIGDHVNVNAFRKQLGVGNPDGTPFNYEALSDDELDALESLLRKAALGEGSEADLAGLAGGAGETSH